MESERFVTRCPCCGRVQTSADRAAQEPQIFKLASQNDTEGLCKLLQAGADPNAFSLMDASMICPLHRAAETGAIDCAQALIAHGACVNVRDSLGRTPLHIVLFTQAAEGAHLNFIRLLITKGADRRCSQNCRKCKMYCKLACKPEKKPLPAPQQTQVYEEYSSSDDEPDFLTMLRKLDKVLKGKVITRDGEVVPYK